MFQRDDNCGGQTLVFMLSKNDLTEGHTTVQAADAEALSVLKRERATKILLQRENRFRLFVDGVQDYAIFMLSPDGHVASWNQGAERLKGYKVDEIIGKHFSCFYSPEENAEGKPQRELRVALERGYVEDTGWRLRKDGQKFWANVVITALFDKDGCLQGFAKITQDMTDQMRAKELLRQSEERFRLFVDGVQDYAIFMLSPEGHVASWNQGAERIKGYIVDEIIGKHFSCFYPPEAIAAGKPEWELRAALEKGHVEDEGWRLRKDGQRFWANVVITALFDDDGRLQGFAKITRDMTERERIERALSDKNTLLESAAEAKDRFMATMSHELRTPLNGIIGFAEFLIDGKPGALNAKQKEYLDDILKSGKHLLDLVNDILDLAKVQAGKMELNPEKFSLGKAIEEVCAVTKPMARQKSIQVEVKIAPEIGQVTLDQQKFKQIAYNLLSNAIKFNDDGGKVEVLAEPHDTNRFKLVVKDTGIGIKPKDIDRLFREFEQLKSGASRRHEGTGLGLALTRRIVELQGGSIGVESEEGKGSSFTVLLPLVTTEVNV
jgi:PAS domain S-box-containing protein